MSDKYNGWTNFETWQANLWLSSIAWVNDAVREQGEAIDGRVVEDLLYEVAVVTPTTGLLMDVFTGWIQMVNLDEIAEGLNEAYGFESLDPEEEQ